GLARIKRRRRKRQRAARVLHRNENDARRQIRNRLLGSDRYRAGRYRGARESRAIRLHAGNREKQEAAAHLAAVGGETGNLDGLPGRIDGVFDEKIAELQRLSFKVARINWSAGG